MDFFLFILSIVIIVSGIIYLKTFWKDCTDVIFGVSIIIIGIVAFILSMVSPSEETLYKLTITDTKTNEVTYEIVTEIEERESYLKYTDEDGNVHYILMGDKEILKEELE